MRSFRRPRAHDGRAELNIVNSANHDAPWSSTITLDAGPGLRYATCACEYNIETRCKRILPPVFNKRVHVWYKHSDEVR